MASAAAQRVSPSAPDLIRSDRFFFFFFENPTTTVFRSAGRTRRGKKCWHRQGRAHTRTRRLTHSDWPRTNETATNTTDVQLCRTATVGRAAAASTTATTTTTTAAAVEATTTTTTTYSAEYHRPPHPARRKTYPVHARGHWPPHPRPDDPMRPL